MHAEAYSGSVQVFSEHKAALWWHLLYAFFWRIWKLAAPKAKAPGAPEPFPDIQKAYKARAAAPGGRAASSWPLTGGRYPLPLFGDAEPECVLGWAMISWATQSSAL